MPRRVDGVSLTLGGIILFIAGMILLFYQEALITLTTSIIGVLLLINSILTYIKQRKQSKKDVSTLLTFILGLILIDFPGISLIGLSLLFSGYLFIYTFVKTITYRIYKRNKVKGRSFIFIEALVLFLFGLFVLLAPYVRSDFVIKCIALHMVALGISSFIEGLSVVLSIKQKNSLKRRFRVSVPVIISAFIPRRTLDEINEFFQLDEDKQDLLVFEEYKNEKEVNLEIFIHVTKKGFGTIGHCDICFDGQVISFGNYDVSSYRMRDMIGEGVLFFANREDYIHFCVHHSKKTLFSYGLSLNEKQIENVRLALNKLKEDVYPWASPYQRIQASKTHFKDIYTDYASMLYKATRASFYKFKSGKFKTYFVMSTNCVLLADNLIGKTGIDIIDVTGIISPGAYQSYLDKEYMKSNSFVVSRKIYGSEENV